MTGLLLSLLCAITTPIAPTKVALLEQVASFPTEWRSAPISAQFERADLDQYDRARTQVDSALAQYPEGFLNRNLKEVLIAKEIKFYGLKYGGTNSSDQVFLTVKERSLGYTDKYIRQALHHEFSSILLRNYNAKFPTKQWMNALPPGFKYGTGGVDALRQGNTSTKLSQEEASDGFVAPYGRASMEEDFNLVAENLFEGGPIFWDYVNQYPLFRSKVNLAIQFYNQIDPYFTESRFRDLARHR